MVKHRRTHLSLMFETVSFYRQRLMADTYFPSDGSNLPLLESAVNNIYIILILSMLVLIVTIWDQHLIRA